MTRRTQAATRPGAAAVELAVLLPLLSLAFVATLDFARVFHATQVLQNAAYAGGLAASGTVLSPNHPDNVTTAARTAACAEGPSFSPPVRAEDVAVTVTSSNVTVTVSCDYPLVSSLVFASTTVRLERSVSLPVAPRPGS